ncbi:MAG: MarR family transcriptional regulator [Microbacteriaceae bacterium]|nr:MarR family transcriptional regulator [Cryobacterium sp.]MBX3103768.1 MarR family transcriptional regulator [Cryobacterium sp.]MCC6377095.1 MarR family transcriptional regulator [Microbacteriaceae bacterium]
MADAEIPEDADHGPMASWPTGRLLSIAGRLVEHAWVEALAEHGLSHAGFIALHLIGRGPLSQTEIAEQAKVEAQTMSRTLDKLERDGYISREKDPNDGRRHVVSRTPRGDHAWEAAKHLEAEVFPRVSHPQELRTALLELIQAGTQKRWDS